MRYQIKLISTETGKTMLTNWMFSNRKEAEKFAADWKALGKPFDCSIVDRKKK